MLLHQSENVIISLMIKMLLFIITLLMKVIHLIIYIFKNITYLIKLTIQLLDWKLKFIKMITINILFNHIIFNFNKKNFTHLCIFDYINIVWIVHPSIQSRN